MCGHEQLNKENTVFINTIHTPTRENLKKLEHKDTDAAVARCNAEL